MAFWKREKKPGAGSSETGPADSAPVEVKSADFGSPLASSSADAISKEIGPVPDSPSSEALETDPEKAREKKRLAEIESRRALVQQLPPPERDVILAQVDIQEAAIGFLRLFKYATTTDWLIMAVSTFAAIVAGAALPVMALVFGKLTGDFTDVAVTGDSSAFGDKLNKMCLYFVYIGIVSFVMTYITTAGFLYTGEHIACEIRQHYLKSLLRQNIAFFEEVGPGDVTTRITTQSNIIQDGISDKLSVIFTALSTFIAALVVSFTQNYKFTFIMLSFVVALVLVMGIGGVMTMKWMDDSQKEYAKAGNVAEEVISSIRTATAFSTQDRLLGTYKTRLDAAARSGFMFESSWSYMVAAMYFLIYLSYGLAFWQGVRFLGRGELSIGELLTVLMAIILGAFSLGQASANFKKVGEAVAASKQIYSTIERQSPIDPLSDAGITPTNLVGHVELRNIKHIYPSRPNVVVMDDVSLDIPAGKTTALVGASGSGKSTIVGLIERFYMPVGGQVLVDGVDITDIKISWLRENVSLVQQEPVLFATSIENNIRYGLPQALQDTLSEDELTERVINAAKMANAHDFILQQPDGYKTDVGERGMLLSGGQKQRIAIARAVIRDPKILLLDEATSALDTKSEGVVQRALDMAAMNRTTIVIAHRLSTIRNADNIVVMSEGKIIEQGRHDDLVQKRGAYHELVEAQRIASETDSDGNSVSLDGKMDLSNEMAGKEYEANQLTPLTTTKSKASIAIEKGKLDAEPAKQYSFMFLARKIASFNKDEWHYMIVGFIAAFVCGAGQPVQAVFYAKAVAALALPLSDYVKMRTDVDFWCWMFFMLAFVLLIAFVVDGVFFAICSERMVRRVRFLALKYMLRQDIEYFDDDEHSVGSLTAFLSTKAQSIAGLSGVTLATIVMALSTLFISIIVSIVMAWKIGLVMTATIPILLGCGFLRFYVLMLFDENLKEVFRKSAEYACESASSIRTVASLNRELADWQRYADSLTRQKKASLKSNIKASSLFAASQSLTFFVFALGFWYGGRKMIDGEYTFFEFFVSYTTIIFGANSAGTVLSFVPDIGKARSASADLCTLFDRQPKIDWWSEEGEKTSSETGGAMIELRDVHFRYPTRKEQPVLRGLSIVAEPGQFVALVGSSGCGKSTTIQMIERFYDPLHGQVLFNGKDIVDCNLADYRSNIALVSQEPTLYQGTIMDNIKMGTSREVTEEEVYAACKDANIYDFIRTLPLGFDTPAGAKGTLLSGGQKQRIAIARALIRNPRVLLLDEATSALDSSAEKVVQEALDKAAKGRTTIAIAHRLSSIQRADRIYVLDKGRVVEVGTHNELLHQNGMYAELVSLQGLDG